MKAEPETPAEITALASALSALADEDPTLRFAWIREKREIQLRIVGKIQLEILSALLLERYGLRARFSAPSVIYRETPAKAGEGYADYLAPKPCWAILRFRIEPLPRGSCTATRPTWRPRCPRRCSRAYTAGRSPTSR